MYFNKLSFIRLLTIINHHKIEREFQNCTGHKVLGGEERRVGLRFGKPGTEVQRDEQEPTIHPSSVGGRTLGQGGKAGIRVSKTLSCATFMRT